MSLKTRIEADGGSLTETRNGYVINFPGENVFRETEDDVFSYMEDRSMRIKEVSISRPNLQGQIKGPGHQAMFRIEHDNINLDELIAKKRQILAPVLATENLVRSLIKTIGGL